MDEARSVFESKYFSCASCGHDAYVTWMEMDEWDADAPEADVTLRLGCASCAADVASTAWQALEASHVASLLSDVHFDVAVKSCACGQRFVVVFTERVDHRDGEDDQTWLGLPVTDDEVAHLRSLAAADVTKAVTELGAARRFLMRANHGRLAAWRESGFRILPHD